MNPEVARIAEALRRVGLISERTVLNDYLSVALARLDLPLLAAALYAAGLRLPEPPATGLDVAWAKAEAALPEGWAITSLTNVTNPDPEWCVIAGSMDDYAEADGPTPAAALLELAARLTGAAE